jgi:nitrate reductase NapE component
MLVEVWVSEMAAYLVVSMADHSVYSLAVVKVYVWVYWMADLKDY